MINEEAVFSLFTPFYPFRCIIYHTKEKEASTALISALSRMGQGGGCSLDANVVLPEGG